MLGNNHLTKQEQDSLAETLVNATADLQEPTTALQLAKQLDYSAGVIETVSTKYNIPNILHGPEATLLNRQIAGHISFKVKLEKLRPEFEKLYSQGLSLIDIKKRMGLSDTTFPKLCEYLGYSCTDYNTYIKAQHEIEKQQRREQKEAEIRSKLIPMLNEDIAKLKSLGIPLTPRQISIVHNDRPYSITQQVIIKCAPYLSDPILLGEEAKLVDDAINRQRHSEASRRNKDKMLATLKETVHKKYGVDSYFQTEEFQKKSKQSRLERYGDANYTNREQAEETLLREYGVTNVQQIPEVRKKTLATWNERYGKDNAEGRAYWEQRIREGTMSKYGVEYPCLVPSCIIRGQIDYLYDNVIFESSYEVCYYIWAKENGHNVERYSGDGLPYKSGGKMHKYYPDFICDGKYVEIKGEHLIDSEGNLINPFTSDQKLQQEVKDKQKLMEELKVTLVTDSSKYIKYVSDKYTSDFVFLFRTKLPFPYLTRKPQKSNDKDLVRYFHPSIYSSKVGSHLSPVEAWEDKRLVLKSALNRLKYVGRCRPSDVVQGFNIAKIAPKVTVFTAKYAKDLIGRYLADSTEIFDPFSGFSGRLLGAYRNKIKYIGRDIDPVHVQESNDLINYLGISDVVSVSCMDVLDASNEEFDALFTCPPYRLKETWGTKLEDKSCDEWIDVCLSKFNCRKYLFVVDSTDKYSDCIVEEKLTKSHLGTNIEKVVLITKYKKELQVTKE